MLHIQTGSLFFILEWIPYATTEATLKQPYSVKS